MIRESRYREIETAAAIIFGVLGLILTAIEFGFFWLGYVSALRFLDSLERTQGKYKDRA